MTKVTANINTEPYRIEIKSPGGNTVIADEPVEKGGKEAGFSPKELLTAALSACTLATLRMYIERKGWDIPTIKVETELTEVDRTYTFTRKLTFNDNVDEEQKKKLIAVANACPVHKILSGPSTFVTEIT